MGEREASVPSSEVSLTTVPSNDKLLSIVDRRSCYYKEEEANYSRRIMICVRACVRCAQYGHRQRKGTREKGDGRTDVERAKRVFKGKRG